MSSGTGLTLWAVHIMDGVLHVWCWGGGLAAAAVLAVFGAWRIRDEEIPRVALLTAAFFVASSVHVRVGPTSVHLLLNGLVGILLGRRACLAIPVGLALQYFLMQHGGFWTLGVNTCVQVVPALLAWQLFLALRRLPWLSRPWFRSGLVAVSAAVWLLSLTYSLTLGWTNFLREQRSLDPTWANAVTFHPLTLLAVLPLAGLAAWAERRLQNAAEFPLGLLVGELTVLGTVILNLFVLYLGGEDDWLEPVLLLLLGYLPLAVLEGVVLGFTVGFLARVKPELLGAAAAPPTLHDGPSPVEERITHAGPHHPPAPPRPAELAGDAAVRR